MNNFFDNHHVSTTSRAHQDSHEQHGYQDPQNRQDAPLTRAQLRELEAKQNRRKVSFQWRNIVVVVLCLVIVGGIGVTAWHFGSRWLSSVSSKESTILDFPGPGSGEVSVTVNPGDSGAAIAKTLVDNGVVASAQAFLQAHKLNENAQNIQPGTYRLQQEMRAEDALLGLLNNENKVDWVINIPPGFTVEQSITRLVGITGYPQEKFDAAMADTVARGLPPEANGSYEGWFAPIQYQFALETTPEEIISQMVAARLKVMNDLQIDSATWMTVLTKASIVEREAALAADRPLVASVINNRLAMNKALQMDSTVHYYSGTSADASTTAEQRNMDNPYNTYKYTGLPPGPIATPSLESLQAVLNPPVTKYVYFVTVNPLTHETLFAETFVEHEKNVELYKAWLKENR